MTAAQPAVTVAELDLLLEAHCQLEKEKETIEETLTAKNKEIGVSMGKVAAYLKELKRTEYSSPVAQAKLVEKWRVSLPQTGEDKAAFFQHLRERGLFDQMVTVNSNSLNALYFKDEEEAKSKGDLAWTMPGIGAPKVFETSTIKPKRK